ncbi:MAG: chorismate synthase [Salibacteraceae bacterium]
MAGNSLGVMFRLTTFGESHGAAIGGVVDGCPAGLLLDVEKIQAELKRRKPGQSKITTQRSESDLVQILSGVFESRTTGMPIAFTINNQDAKSKDYDHLIDTYRPSHADYTYAKKYGHRDHRGGGRSSARETACRVVGGAIAKQLLETVGLNIWSYVSSVGEIECNVPYDQLNPKNVDSSIVRCPHTKTAESMIELIEQTRKDGDTIGGVITCVVQNTPVGLGEPVFDKLNADLAKSMLSINAVKGFEIGSGFAGAKMMGSDHNDAFMEDGKTATNHSGGIQGGISNGMDIVMKVAFKPVATIMRDQTSIDEKGNPVALKGKGRHDPCVVPRAVPIVEAMTALTLADHYLRDKASKIS